MLEETFKQLLGQATYFLIKHGLPLDFDPDISLNHTIINHRSEMDHPQAYLEEERNFQAILGPNNVSPLSNLHISPLMARDKPGAKHRRVIADLRYPQGHSVNAGVDGESYLKSEFLLTLPSVDHITDQIQKLGKGCKIYKIYISRAFRHVKLDPGDYNLTGIHFNSYFVDTCLAFGSRNGSTIFERLTYATRFIMTQKGHKVTNYIDDIVRCDVNSSVDRSFQTLFSLLQDLGLNISQQKRVHLTTRATCLGVEINTADFTVSIPTKKLEEI